MSDDAFGVTRRITLGGKAATEVLVPGLEVRVLEGPDAGLTCALLGPSLQVGSDPGCELVLADPGVSRRHALLTREPEGVLVRDLDSTNGTFVDGVRAREAYLEVGVRLQVGATVLEVAPAAESLVAFPRADEQSFHGLIGASEAMQEVFALIRQLAPTDLPVAVTGETGCGKELVARALHLAGPRADKPFLVLDCGAVVPELLPARLFGHQKGAFTGADADRPGILEAAEGGTVFLDEVGELSPEVQPNLLRALEARRVVRLGETRERPVDFRVVSATNRDLAAEATAGRFRLDLLYRLSCVTLRLPPLRERREDIPALAGHFLAECAARNGLAAPAVTDDGLDALRAHDWPGNLRQLRNVAETLCALGGGRPVDAAAVTRTLAMTGAVVAGTPAAAGVERPPGAAGAGPSAGGPEGGERDAGGSAGARDPAEAALAALPLDLEAAERAVLLRALEETGWNKKGAARLLGISHTTLFRKLKVYDLRPPGDEA